MSQAFMYVPYSSLQGLEYLCYLSTYSSYVSLVVPGPRLLLQVPVPTCCLTAGACGFVVGGGKACIRSGRDTHTFLMNLLL